MRLLGDLWQAGVPPWDVVFSVPQARLHLYGKKDARPGRKMGHILLVDVPGTQGVALADGLLTRLAAH